MTDLVFKGQNDQVLTNSLLVAEKFGKRHADVVRAIENSLTKGSESTNAKLRSSFVLSNYIDNKGEE
jgi:phage regulator Rha-like protein